MVNITIPNIIKKLAKKIDIKNNLYYWEEFIGILHHYFIEEFMINVLNELYVYYPNYPIECLFELILHNEPIYPEDLPFWYRSINKIYNQFYSKKIDRELFDKYLLFSHSDRRYFIALLDKKSFNIPKNSRYKDMRKLVKKRYDKRKAQGSCPGVSVEDIETININKFTNYSYAHSYLHKGDFYSIEGKNVEEEISHILEEKIAYRDKDDIIYILKTTFLKLAIFETDEFEELKKKNTILESFSNFHDFLIYKWGIVQYFKYLCKYGNYEEYSKLYNEFFILLEKEAKDIDNIIAIENLSEIKSFYNKEIVELYPDEIEETILIEGAKKQIIVNAYERNLKAREACINKYGYNCFICDFDFKKIYGELGEKFIHVHHLKPLSEIQKEYEVNPITDLRPVCPNCHAMLHRKIPAYSIEDIQNIIKGQEL